MRVLERMPVTATNKIDRAALRRTGFRCAEPVWWTPYEHRAGADYRPLTAEDTEHLSATYRAAGRADLLGR